jgi:hypothetical protein
VLVKDGDLEAVAEAVGGARDASDASADLRVLSERLTDV